MFLHDGDKRHLGDCSNHGNLDGCINFDYRHVLAVCNTITCQDRNLSNWITTDMTSQGISRDTNAEDHHDGDVVLPTIEASNDSVQPSRVSQSILAASAASLPIFERSPAPSPPSSEERNASQEGPGTKGGTDASQKLQDNEKQLH